MGKETEPVKEYKTGGGRAHYILVICTLLYMVNFMDRQVVAAASAGGLLGGFCYLAAARFYPGDMEKVKGELLLAER